MRNMKDSVYGELERGYTEPPRVLSDLAGSAGVKFNGNSHWDIQVHDDEVYRRILTRGSLGFGESYMDGLWDCLAMDEMFCRLLNAEIEEKLVGWARLRLLGEVLRHRLFNLQTSQRAFQVGEQHYDIGNDVFEAMLDSTMSYSCGYWHNAEDLEQAQQNKLDMICRKLELTPGEKLLEIGCGWGSLARHAAENYNVEVMGVTVSKEQQQLAQERCRNLPVTIELMDYRDLKGQFDKVVSVGMFEHVGTKNYPQYFDMALRLMKDDGLFLLHTIGIYKTSRMVDPWIDKYVFPNGKLPSAEEIATALNDRLLIEDWHNFGQDYDRTLMAWWRNFDNAWPKLEHRYGKRFYRMWKYYLMSCAGVFRSRQGQLWQLVLSKRTRTQMYRSVR
jgi:cyclopropane-fatty-acyl-phospholipid synthase